MTNADWFRDLPAWWTVTRLKNIVESTQTGVWGSDPRGDTDDIFCVRVADFDRPRAAVGNVKTVRSVPATDREPRLLSAGDILLEKSGGTDINPVGFSVIFSGVYPAVSSNFITRLRVARGQFPKFWLYALAASYATKRTERSVRRTTGIQNLDLTAFLNEKFPVPPFSAQRAIAGFLDRETARIDTLIEEQQRLIDLLHERRDAEWSSGLEAAKEVGHEVQVRRILSSIADGPFGSSLTSAHYSDEGARVIRLGNIGTGEFRDDDKAFISLEYAERLSAHAAEPGDVIIAGLGDDRMPLGRAAVMPDIGPAIVKADCYRARPTDNVSPDYLAWALSAPPTRIQIRLLARGATRARLNTSVVQQVTIPLPPRDLQEACLSRWISQASKIDSLITETEKFIELAWERRAALITAAVTGQIDVRDEVP